MNMDCDLTVYNRHENDDSGSVGSSEESEMNIQEHEQENDDSDDDSDDDDDDESMCDDLYEEIDELVEEHREKTFEPSTNSNQEQKRRWSLGYCMYLENTQNKSQAIQSIVGTTLPAKVFFTYPIHTVREYIFESTRYLRESVQVQNRYSPIRIQLFQLVEQEDGTFVSINKMHWIKQIQRRWKRIYHEHMMNMTRMCLQTRIQKDICSPLYRRLTQTRKLMGLLR